MNEENKSTLLEEEDVFEDSFEEKRPEKIRVLMVEPGQLAHETEIGTELFELQRAVGGGLIEPFYPFDEEVCIVCNEEGKFNGMEPNRAICDENGKVIDIVFGPFFICDCSKEYFGSLTDEQIERYKEKFEKAEYFYSVGGQIRVERYIPIQNGDAR